MNAIDYWWKRAKAAEDALVQAHELRVQNLDAGIAQVQRNIVESRLLWDVVHAAKNARHWAAIPHETRDRLDAALAALETT